MNDTHDQEFGDEIIFSSRSFSLDEVSPLIREQSRNNFSLLLRKMSEQSMEEIGDKLHLHKSNVCRMKENGDLQKAAAVLVALGLDFDALLKENVELRRQNQALQVVASSNLSLHKG